MRVGTLAYSTHQGLGHIAYDFYKNGIVTDVFVLLHPNYDNHAEEWYPDSPRTNLRGMDTRLIEEWVKGKDLMLFFETPFHWPLVNHCRKLGIKTALMPMYEWHLEEPPALFDRYLCPSRLDLDYFIEYGPSEFIPIPVSLGTWRQKLTAHKFLHNAGHIGSRNHKGTEEILQAMPFVKSPIELTIRAQNVGGMRRLLSAAHWIENDKRVTIELGEKKYESLFGGYDVYLAPEKYNGCSLPLQEAYAAGMLVMSSDRYPMNTWLAKDPLIPVQEYSRARVGNGYIEFDEAIIAPEVIAKTIDDWYEQDIHGYSYRGQQWALENSWEVMKPKWLEALQRCMQ